MLLLLLISNYGNNVEVSFYDYDNSGKIISCKRLDYLDFNWLVYNARYKVGKFYYDYDSNVFYIICRNRR